MSKDFKETIKESIKEAPKVPAGGFKVRPGLIGGLLLVAGGAYYYYNYMQKSVPVPAPYQPATNIKKDANDLLNAGNKLAVDLKK